MQVVRGLPEGWDRLAAGAPLLATGPWLRAMAGRVGGESYTFLLRDRFEPVLAIHATVVESAAPGEVFDLHNVLVSPAPALPLSGATRAARARLAATAPGPEHWRPSLVAMLPGYECHPVGPWAARPGALAELVDGILAWARERRLRAVAFLYTPPEHGALQAVLAARAFRRVPASRTWTLPAGAGWEGYLAALPRKRRKEARRELRTLEAAGVTLARGDPHACLDELTRLRCLLLTKYRGAADPAAERKRLELLLDCGDDAPLLVRADLDGTLLGYALFVTHHHTWWCVRTGTDYRHPHSRHAYFATAFYHPIRLAAGAGITLLHYGQGSWQAKRSRGCHPTDLPTWTLPLDPALTSTLDHTARVTQLIR